MERETASKSPDSYPKPHLPAGPRVWAVTLRDKVSGEERKDSLRERFGKSSFNTSQGLLQQLQRMPGVLRFLRK